MVGSVVPDVRGTYLLSAWLLLFAAAGCGGVPSGADYLESRPQAAEPAGGAGAPGSGATSGVCPVDEVMRPAAEYAGLTEAEAEAAARLEGAPLRVVCRDGVSYPITEDYQEIRVNLTVEGGRVSSAWRG